MPFDSQNPCLVEQQHHTRSVSRSAIPLLCSSQAKHITHFGTQQLANVHSTNTTHDITYYNIFNIYIYTVYIHTHDVLGATAACICQVNTSMSLGKYISWATIWCKTFLKSMNIIVNNDNDYNYIFLAVNHHSLYSNNI